MAAAFGLDTRGVSMARGRDGGRVRPPADVDVEIPSLEELGFAEDEIPMLADKASPTRRAIGNPRDVDAAAYQRIYARAFELGAKR